MSRAISFLGLGGLQREEDERGKEEKGKEIERGGRVRGRGRKREGGLDR
jgi:hypothetical protein